MVRVDLPYGCELASLSTCTSSTTRHVKAHPALSKPAHQRKQSTLDSTHEPAGMRASCIKPTSLTGGRHNTTHRSPHPKHP
jgi:hypothetical protein